MSRPGLIIGLGGTGQWVLTWLKRDLLLSNNGTMPDNVKLLAIDTNTQLEAGVRSVGGRQEEAVRLGGVTLGRGEFIYVGGDSRPVAERVKAGALTNIGQWYQAEKWLDILPPASFILDDGAGRIRQFGRVAIFKDILGQGAGSKIWAALTTALDAVSRKTDDKHRLEIAVVGSFAGGTGSGMFIDIALLARLMAEQRKIHHVLRGFFALPSVFTALPETEMLARTFAAWRELNRFMVVDSDFPMPEIEYVKDQPKFRTRPSRRIFDACYLVDSKRAGSQIASEAKNGVHPMVAEVLSAILDEYAGTDYSQYVFANLSPEYARTPEKPLYSALGAFTVQVPAHYKQEVSTHVFSQQMILSLLRPKNGLNAQGALRHLDFADPAMNQEVGVGFPGRSRCSELLSSQTVTYLRETAKPTRFTGRIDDVVKTGVDKAKRPALINQMARAGGGTATRDGGTAQGWVGSFTDLGDDPAFTALRKNVQDEVNFGLVAGFSRQKGQTAEDVRDLMNTKIPEVVRTHYGGLLADGTETHGTFGDRLREAKEFHLNLFRRIVRLRLLDMLMGHSDQDPVKAKSGKLGYAWDYYDGLVDEFEQFLGIMDEVKRRREEVKPEIKLQGLSENAKRVMVQNTNAKLFWFFESPSVKISENDFLQAQQRVVDLRKEDLLHLYVVDTAREMKTIVTDTRDAIQRWIWHLATGDDPSQIPGLWTGIGTSLKNVNTDHSFDTTTTAVQSLVATTPPPVANEDVAAALKQWEWLADYAGTPPRLNLSAKIAPEAADQAVLALSDPSEQPTMELRAKVGGQNQRNLMALGRRRFAGLAERTTVAEAIKSSFPNPENFSTQVAPGAEPLFDGDVEASARRKSNMIRVQVDVNDPYFYGPNGLEGILREAQSRDRDRTSDEYNIRVVNSENPYKLTLVRTDDLYEPEAFSAWSEALNAYRQHIKDEGDPQDPVLMQNFAAESQSVVVERELAKSGKEYRPLHPRVVMLLEDRIGFEQFLNLGMLGMIHPPDAEQKIHRWELAWERDGIQESFWLTRGWDPNQDKKKGRAEPDMINAIHGYVVMRRSWAPNRDDRIDYAYAAQLIEDAQRALKSEGEIQLLQDNLQEGFVAWIKSQVRQREGGKTVERADYADLASVAEMILRQRMAYLQKAQKQATSTGPFKVARPLQPSVGASSVAPLPAKPVRKIEPSQIGKWQSPTDAPYRPSDMAEPDVLAEEGDEEQSASDVADSSQASA